jgi:hypothetical protein
MPYRHNSPLQGKMAKSADAWLCGIDRSGRMSQTRPRMVLRTGLGLKMVDK